MLVQGRSIHKRGSLFHADQHPRHDKGRGRLGPHCAEGRGLARHDASMTVAGGRGPETPFELPGPRPGLRRTPSCCDACGGVGMECRHAAGAGSYSRPRLSAACCALTASPEASCGWTRERDGPRAAPPRVYDRRRELAGNNGPAVPKYALFLVYYGTRVAEGVGFEPTVRIAYNGFRDRPVRPLRHPSAGGADPSAKPVGVASRTPRLSPTGRRASPRGSRTPWQVPAWCRARDRCRP